MDGSATFYDEAAINKNININDCNECCLRSKLFFMAYLSVGDRIENLVILGKVKIKINK